MIAIEDVKRYLKGLLYESDTFDSILESHGMIDPETAFQLVSTLRQLLQTELAWVMSLTRPVEILHRMVGVRQSHSKITEDASWLAHEVIIHFIS